jgi:hypothetical protein
MLRALISKEILSNLLNLRFVAVCFATTALMLGSAGVMLSEHRMAQRDYQTNQALYGQMLENGEGFFSGDNVILRQPSVLGVLALGGQRDPEAKAAVDGRRLPVYRPELKRSPLANLFPPFYMVFVVGVVLSLLVVLLVFDAVAGEREEGTLRLLLASPVARDQLILAKWLGGIVSLAIPFAASAVAVMALLAFAPGTGLDGGGWARVLGIFGVFALFLVVMFSLALMISVLFRRSGPAEIGRAHV